MSSSGRERPVTDFKEVSFSEQKIEVKQQPFWVLGGRVSFFLKKERDCQAMEEASFPSCLASISREGSFYSQRKQPGLECNTTHLFIHSSLNSVDKL